MTSSKCPDIKFSKSFSKDCHYSPRRDIPPPTSQISILQFLSGSVQVKTSAPMVKHRSEYQGCLCCPVIACSLVGGVTLSQYRDTAETSENNTGDVLSLLSLYSFLTCQSSPQCRLDFLDASASRAIFLSLRVKSFSCCFLNGCTRWSKNIATCTILLLILFSYATNQWQR